MSEWLECNCFLISKKLLELDVKQDSTPARTKIRISSIESFRETFEDSEEEINPNETMIYLHSGESLVIDIPYNKLSELLNG